MNLRDLGFFRRRYWLWNSAIAATVLVCVAAVWYYRTASIPGKIAVFEIPTWIAGASNITYSIAIGESQIHPYGTIWKCTVYPSGLINAPER